MKDELLPRVVHLRCVGCRRRSGGEGSGGLRTRCYSPAPLPRTPPKNPATPPTLLHSLENSTANPTTRTSRLPSPKPYLENPPHPPPPAPSPSPSRSSRPGVHTRPPLELPVMAPVLQVNDALARNERVRPGSKQIHPRGPLDKCRKPLRTAFNQPYIGRDCGELGAATEPQQESLLSLR